MTTPTHPLTAGPRRDWEAAPRAAVARAARRPRRQERGTLTTCGAPDVPDPRTH